MVALSNHKSKIQLITVDHVNTSNDIRIYPKWPQILNYRLSGHIYGKDHQNYKNFI